MLESSGIFGSSGGTFLQTPSLLSSIAEGMGKGYYPRISVDVMQNGKDLLQAYQYDDMNYPKFGRPRLHINHKSPYLNGFFVVLEKSFFTSNGIETFKDEADKFFINIFTGEAYSGDNMEIVENSKMYDLDSLRFDELNTYMNTYYINDLVDYTGVNIHLTALMKKSKFGDYVVEKVDNKNFILVSDKFKDLRAEFTIGIYYDYQAEGMVSEEVLKEIANDFLNII